MDESALLRLIGTSCCGLRKSKADKRCEEQGFEESQALLEQYDSSRVVESLDGAEAQDLLLRVEMCDDQVLRVEEESQDGDNLQDEPAVQDDGAARGDVEPLGDGEHLDSEEMQDDTTARDDELVQDDETVRNDGLGQDGEGLQDNTKVQELNSLDYAVSDRGSIEVEDSVQSAPVSQHHAAASPIRSQMVEREAPITPPTTTITPVLPPNDRTGGTTSQIIDPVQISKPRKLDLLSLLTGSKEICDRIMSLLFPGDTANISEYPQGMKISRRHKHQVEYSVTDRNSLNRQRSRHWTTYFATRNPQALDIARITTDRPSCNFSFKVLLVNEIFEALGLVYLYRRNFRFQCSAQGAKKFLMEHKLHVRSMTQVELFYHFKNEPSVIETDGQAWHDMMIQVRHDFACIPRIHVHVGHGFWAKANWIKGPAAVIGQRSLRDDGQYRPPFLCDIVKIAAPADRWKDHDDPGTHCTEGTDVQISIEGTMSEEEVEFVEQLNEEVLRRGRTRPLHRKKYGPSYVWRRSLLWKRPYTCTPGEKAKHWSRIDRAGFCEAHLHYTALAGL
jgi:hypothetical protein